ncbi:MAG: hypothetical protein A3J94_08575 [Syntrophus sp. RIFOXYC2_FULL_54_9]|nr:MAG: hypothetical protein A3J94_08575 [Syntrophus sp. RIFOXYC2_FULL_54_9]
MRKRRNEAKDWFRHSKIMDQKGDRMVKRQFLPPAGHLAIHFEIFLRGRQYLIHDGCTAGRTWII